MLLCQTPAGNLVEERSTTSADNPSIVIVIIALTVCHACMDAIIDTLETSFISSGRWIQWQNDCVRYRFVKWSKMADSRPASFLLHIYESGGNPFFMNLSGRRHFSDRGASPVQTAHAFLTGEHTLDKMPQIYSGGKQLGELFQFCAGSQ